MIDEKKFLEEKNNMIDAREIYRYIKKEINPYGKPFEGTVFEFGCKVMDYIEAMEKQPKADWIPCEEVLKMSEADFITHILSTICDYAKANNYEITETVKTMGENLVALTEIADFDKWKEGSEHE